MFIVFLAMTDNKVSCLAMDDAISLTMDASAGASPPVANFDADDPVAEYPLPNIFCPVDEMNPDPPNNMLRTSRRSLALPSAADPIELNIPPPLSSFLYISVNLVFIIVIFLLGFVVLSSHFLHQYVGEAS
jgi:hypothetical protein